LASVAIGLASGFWWAWIGAHSAKLEAAGVQAAHED